MHFHYQLGGGWRPVLVIHIYCFVIFIVNIHFFSVSFALNLSHFITLVLTSTFPLPMLMWISEPIRECHVLILG